MLFRSSPGGFDPVQVWNRMASGDLTVFMAVPTIYARLIATWEAADSLTRTRWSDGARRLRLMVSGSAALPVTVLERWRELTGHVLLERYGMTELGMALSNTIERRIPGHVGWPFPGVEAMIDADGQLVGSQVGVTCRISEGSRRDIHGAWTCAIAAWRKRCRVTDTGSAEPTQTSSRYRDITNRKVDRCLTQGKRQRRCLTYSQCRLRRTYRYRRGHRVNTDT